MIMNKYFIMLNIILHDLIIWNDDKFIDYCNNYIEQMEFELIKENFCEEILRGQDD